MSKSNYPRLLPAAAPTINDTASLVPDATCTTYPLPTDLLIALSNRLREGTFTTTKEFIALCEYSINPQFDAHVQDMTGTELRTASAVATIGIKRCASANINQTTANSHRKTHRSSKAAQSATTRDQRRCLITLKDDPIEVAHLVPLSTYDNTNDLCRVQSAFLSLLRMFADENPSPAGNKLINRMENLITLSTETHRYWDTGKITLQPVGDPLSIFTANPDALLTHYDVIFSYVPGHRRPSDTVGWDETTLVQLSPIPSLQFSEDDDPGLHNIFLTRLIEQIPDLGSQPTSASAGKRASRGVGRFKELETGTVIRLTTNDPHKYPFHIPIC
ncbi:hypothetical protein BGX38DRAFT_1225559 [Terfezia claveryi]|nr:hypothetical protein BGX38DRAFT_1225559 [Terfezia claveryi]